MQVLNERNLSIYRKAVARQVEMAMSEDRLQVAQVTADARVLLDLGLLLSDESLQRINKGESSVYQPVDLLMYSKALDERYEEYQQFDDVEVSEEPEDLEPEDPEPEEESSPFSYFDSKPPRKKEEKNR